MPKIANELAELIRATNILGRAAGECEYDVSYFCHREIEAVERAEKEFLDAVRRALEDQK